jgi:hypothetical protein
MFWLKTSLHARVRRTNGQLAGRINVPTSLAGGKIQLNAPQIVVSTAGSIVFVAFRTSAARVATKEQTLTLAAPPPVRLVRCLDIVQQGVVSAADLNVGPACRTLAAWIPSKEQSLTLVTPPPVCLTVSSRCVVPKAIVTAPAVALDIVGTYGGSAVEPVYDI